jgi:PKD repeat protein
MRIATVGALAAALTSVAGCELARQSAPPLSGPASYGTTVTLRATPDRIAQDGVSMTTVTAEVSDAAGKAISGLALQWNVTASDGRTFVEPSEQTTLTDASGRASVRVTSPPAPSELPASPLTLAIMATPVGDDSGNAAARLVQVTLVPPPGTPPINIPPVAAFTMSPANPALLQAVTFDASATTDEGVACMGCTYGWDFGDGGTGSGVTELHQYTMGGTFTVVLTVRDSRGAVATAAKTFSINAPTSPVAVLTFSPAGVDERAAGSTVFFDGGSSTVGAGGRIDSYTWIWNDGTPSTMTQSPQTTHIFTAPGSYVVRLTVTDNFGRTATTTVTITII